MIDGDGEIAEICRLTCLEVGLEVVVVSSDDTNTVNSTLPVLAIIGTDLRLSNFLMNQDE